MFARKAPTYRIPTYINAQNKEGDTPLHIALTNKHNDMVMTLINTNGIKVNIKNNSGKTPLDLVLPLLQNTSLGQCATEINKLKEKLKTKT